MLAKNKLLSVLLAIMLVLCISACGDGKKVANDQTKKEKIEKTTVVETTLEQTTIEEFTTVLEEPTTQADEVSSESVTKHTKKVKVKIKHASSTLKLSQIPKYKVVKAPYIKVNGNKPTFKQSEIKTSSFEHYSKLDSKGRCGVAIASISKDIMPKSKRTSISEVHPSGWHSYRYSNVEGESLYNRCHLIAHQLTGENANEKNLITGTRYMNNEGMLPFENIVADYVHRTNNHVMYRVTPMYKNDDLVARGVHMEAYSVEDKGAGVSFNVYCYNVQPGVKITYADGTSSGKHMISSGWSNSPNINKNRNKNNSNRNYNNSSNRGNNNKGKKGKKQTYILSLGTKKFHYPSCPSVNQILPKNKGKFKGNRKTLINQGYAPCKNCNP